MTLGALRAAATGTAGIPQRMLFVVAGVLMCVAALVAAGQGQPRLAVMLVLAPLLEEAVFRAGLQEVLLRRWHGLPLLVNAVTAAAFSLAHVIVRGDAAAFAVVLPALLIGAIYQRTRSVTICAAVHAAMNGLWVALASRGLPL
jgi:membrane protease YdiL (CAAX protease family)